MKTTFYTYRNQKLHLVEKDRFYLVKNKKELDLLIEELLHYDAVTTPYDQDPKFPMLLELQSGFAPVLKYVDNAYVQKVLKKEINRSKLLLNLIKK